jgi:hypothetical protein
MTDLDQAQPTIRRYLLGRLDDDGRERFEEQFVRDAEFRETALIVEEELIDDYLAGLLLADERARFDAHYLMGPRQRQELNMAQAIREYALESPEVMPPVVPKPMGRRLLDFLTGRGWVPAVVFAALLLVAVLGSWFWGARIWQGGELELVNPAAIVRLNKPPYSTEPALSIPLAEFHNRAGGQGQKFSIPAGIEIVQLQLALPATSYQSYQATLRVTDGGELFTVSDLGAQQTEAGRILNLRLPARILTPRDYTLSVSGRTTAGGDEGVADYSFRVLK